MSDNSNRPIVVRRKKPSRHREHGVWKIAYADFMTTLMAFFLVMWLLASLSTSEVAQVSKYFRTPLITAVTGGHKNSESHNIIPGGGDDPVHSKGSISKTVPELMRNPDPTHARDQIQQRKDQQQLKALEKKLQTKINQDPFLKKAKSQLRVDITTRGLRLQIIDAKDQPMFKIGSAQIEPYMKKLLMKIAPLLDSLPNRIMLIGHTDDLQYASGAMAYSNWELSTDRANASRRALVAGGMDDGKVLRVVGAAATMRLRGSEPGAPANRRISVLILNRKTTKRILNRGRDPIKVMK